MSFYKRCPHCGANLDPGEHCDCKAQKERPTLPTIESWSLTKQIALTATLKTIITE
ncbi:MAG: hypothetical protein IJD91_08645 [Clostridia bacterium]|nr:hypothetical protein [Clostridia bacterium]